MEGEQSEMAEWGYTRPRAFSEKTDAELRQIAIVNVMRRDVIGNQEAFFDEVEMEFNRLKVAREYDMDW